MMLERFKMFLAAWQKSLDEYYAREYPTFEPGYAVVSFIEGKRYWKIIRKTGVSRSCVGFVNKATGDIYKSASWAAPAKHVRGSIMAEDLGMSCMTIYGPNYLRG